MRYELTNRKDKDFWEAGDCAPFRLDETTTDAEDDCLDVVRANGAGSQW